MSKEPHKLLIAAILFAIIIALAINTQPSQASMPGQTVPTVKPKPTKTKSVSGGNQSTSVSTDTSIPLIIATSTSISNLVFITQTPSPIESVIPSITAQVTFIQTQPSVQKTSMEANSFTVTPTYLLTQSTTPTVTPVIQSIRTDTPAGFTGGYILLILLVTMVIVGIIGVSRRKNRVQP